MMNCMLAEKAQKVFCIVARNEFVKFVYIESFLSCS